MWQRAFETMLERLIRAGGLRVTMPDGRTRTFGAGAPPDAAIAIRDAATVRALVLEPELALGEAYVDGRLTIEGDDIEGLIRLLVRNRRSGGMPGWVKAVDRARFGLKRAFGRNGRAASRANVAHHYDLSNDLYRLFLDADMQYSCAYFTDPAMSLEDAQAAKKAHIAAKLCLAPGMRVLDIGCGWGGMAITLARDHGARVTGVTLSQRQLELGRERVRAAGLEDRVDLRLQDYRDLEGPFDAVVSVGMLEHVGLAHLPTYFDKVAHLLAPGGVALIHTIAITAPPGPKSKWLDRYIFPGGYIPALSELAPAMEASGLWTTDIEIWRLHYAMTLRHWLARFDAAREEVLAAFDERFVRMWRYYLVICIVSFEENLQGVAQIQLAHRADAVPLTRDYLHAHAPPGSSARRSRLSRATAPGSGRGGSCRPAARPPKGRAGSAQPRRKGPEQ